jgi:hypothetical protein
MIKSDNTGNGKGRISEFHLSAVCSPVPDCNIHCARTCVCYSFDTRVSEVAGKNIKTLNLHPKQLQKKAERFTTTAERAC